MLTIEKESPLKTLQSRMRNISYILFFFYFTGSLSAQDHPKLIMSKAGIAEIKGNIDKAPLFASTLSTVRSQVDAEIALGVRVPIPKDMSGGYTHEQHKQNFFILQKAGALFQITGDEKYAQYVKDCFEAYANMFPTLPIHPTDRSYATGKIFWQCLNDANWLVYCSQAYDCIYEWLSPDERGRYESQLFRPLADFLSVENPQFFNRVHNHSTWANAAVGMIGLVMDDEELVNRALYGLQNDGIDGSMVDNDGGYIKVDGVSKAGFFAQLDFSFSPDGHFTEGPYYLRYAMTPFLLFSQSLHQARPDLKIFDYRGGILKKAIYSLLYETDAQGQFFPINDSQKGMSWLAREVVSAIDIGYVSFGYDPMLLSIAAIQGEVTLDQSGYRVARDIALGKAEPFAHKSISYTDGAEGEHGGLSIIRSSNKANEEICVLMKYAAHGMGHGHFDRLSYSVYNDIGEVIQDYGAARWVNIDQKGGGRYLRENQTFAKQTIAHNTVVVDEASQNKGEVKKAENNRSMLHFENFDDKDFQVVSVKDSSAYSGAVLQRTVFLVSKEEFQNPLIIDLFKVKSAKDHQYDLPFWFKGHLLQTDFDYDTIESPSKMGDDQGYQHVRQEAISQELGDFNQVSWFEQGRFFTLSTILDSDDKIIFARAGATDPSFNLRHDPAVILRKNNKSNALFANILESHGRYDPVSEIPTNPFSSIADFKVIMDTEDYTLVRIESNNGTSWMIGVANMECSKDAKHSIEVDGNKIEWTGPYIMK